MKLFIYAINVNTKDFNLGSYSYTELTDVDIKIFNSVIRENDEEALDYVWKDDLGMLTYDGKSETLNLAYICNDMQSFMEYYETINTFYYRQFDGTDNVFVEMELPADIAEIPILLKEKDNGI